jgi:altronate hydrolase
VSINSAITGKVLQLDPRDNVLVALADLPKGEIVKSSGQDYLLLCDVPAKHKLLTQNLSAGEDVIMYGVLVGKAAQNLQRGELLSTRNIRHAAASFHAKEGAARWTPPDISVWRSKTFLGYNRPDGQVGTRNFWIVLPLVFCENRNLHVLKQAFEEELGFTAPQIYRRQVSELARLYRQGNTQQIKEFSRRAIASRACVSQNLPKR